MRHFPIKSSRRAAPSVLVFCSLMDGPANSRIQKIPLFCSPVPPSGSVSIFCLSFFFFFHARLDSFIIFFFLSFVIAKIAAA